MMMKYVCPDCGFETAEAGRCPTCETPLLKREDGDKPAEAEKDGLEGVEPVGEGLGDIDDDGEMEDF